MDGRDITREMTLTAKKGFRDAKSWEIGNEYLWGAIVRIENQHGLRGWVLTFGSLGFSVALQFAHQDYRGS